MVIKHDIMKRFRFSEDELMDFDYRFNYIGSLEAEGFSPLWGYENFWISFRGTNDDGYWEFIDRETNYSEAFNASDYSEFVVEIIKRLRSKTVSHEEDKVVVRIGDRIVVDFPVNDIIDPNSAEILVTKEEMAKRYIWTLTS